MHLAILTQYYPPETGAPQRRLSSLAQHFRDCGHSVTVLTAMPNYPQGRIFDGYRGLYKRSAADGIQVIRSFIYATKSTRAIPRLLNYFSFVFSSMMVGGIALTPPDYLLVESPPLFLGISGYLLSRLKSARLIFNVSDLWPESAARLGVIARSDIGYRVAESLEAFCYRKAWLVTGQSKSILQDINNRFPKARCFHLSNGADTHMFKPTGARETGNLVFRKENGEFLAAYVGLHGLAQGLEQVLAAAKLMEANEARLLLVGDGPCKQDLQAQARRGELRNVEFFDLQPADTIPTLLADVDVLLVMLKTEIPGAVPSKLYEAMAMAKPVILVGTGEAAEIVRDSDCGIVVAPGDAQSLAAALRTLRANPDLCRRLGENGRRAVL
ncbi:MAG: glycosyltransferase family 4 protein, partial [Acidobacteriaceae bacterium]|nr:glycosyltransferase family 4 protein [Acidobacteriaceae bacterium]